VTSRYSTAPTRTRSSSITGAPFDHLIFRIRRLELEARCPRLERATAVRVPFSGGEGFATASYLRSLAALGSVSGNESAERLATTGLDLVATAVAAVTGLSADPEPRQRVRLSELKRCTRARLGDPRLTPATVARAQFVSVRQLHRLFAREQTTFGAFVREERLRRCASDLSDIKLEHVPIAEIAARWGYRSPAHFTRAFTARFGIGPRDFRRDAR
jgi:AraC-like DNA-binding protein